MSKFLGIFTRRERFQLGGLLLLVLFTGFVEMIGVGIVLPFFSILVKPHLIQENTYSRWLFSAFSFESNRDFILASSVGMILFLVLKNLFLGFSSFVQESHLGKLRVQMINTLFKGYLRSPYEFHLNHNSVALWRDLTMVDNVFTGLLKPAFELITEGLVALMVFGLMVQSNSQITFAASAILTIPSILLYLFLKKKMKNINEEQFSLVAVSSKTLFETLAGIKEVLALNRQEYFLEKYFFESHRLGILRRNATFLNSLSRLVLEPVITGSIVGAVLLMIFVQNYQPEYILPTVALLATAAFRLLVSANKIINAANTLTSNKILQDRVCSQLIRFRKSADHPPSQNSPHSKLTVQPFQRLDFDRISYRYPSSSKEVLSNFSLTIKRGDRIGIVGASGAGKSTLVDILLGLLTPTSGDIRLNQNHLSATVGIPKGFAGYVPQNIFLSDDTVRRNIAFGIPDKDIDEARVNASVLTSQLFDVVEGLPQKLDTVIGERGTRLSGGQRQRIGIARALYFNSDVIIMDEATSALDSETENEFVRAIDMFDESKTIIIVAHRHTLFRNCNRIIALKEGRAVKFASYEDFLENKPQILGANFT